MGKIFKKLWLAGAQTTSEAGQDVEPPSDLADMMAAEIKSPKIEVELGEAVRDEPDLEEQYAQKGSNFSESLDSEISGPPESRSTQQGAGNTADIPFLSSERRLHETQRFRELEEELPQFKISPAGSSSDPRLAPDLSSEVGYAKIREAFTPRRPRKLGHFFSGRRQALSRIITAIEEERAHVIIFGPRGIGKTSLANVLAQIAIEVEYQVRNYPCSSDTTFEEIFRGLLAQLPADFMDRAARATLTNAKSFEQLLPRDEFGPTELAVALGHLALEHVIFIVDEFDRITSERTKNQLAESIKNLSDAEAHVTIVILGIAQSAEELVGKHPSIQRHMIGIHLPLMEPDELNQIIRIGEREAKLIFEDTTREMIVSFSKGLPYFTQLLCLYSGQAALFRDSTTVEVVDFRNALNKCVEEADPLVKVAYELATQSDTNQFMADILFAAASARFDEYGCFTAKDASKVVVNDHGHRVLELTLHRALSALNSEKYYGLIEKRRMPSGTIQYSFANQTMRQYIILRQALARGLM